MKTKLLLFLSLFSLIINAQTNLVPNGDFENWSSSSQPDNWFRYFSGFVSQSTSAQNGTSSTNMMIADGTFNFINSEYFPVVANKTYRITLYHKLVSGSFSAIDLSLYHKPSAFKEELTKKTDAVFSNSEWRKIEFDYTPTVSENIEVDIWTTGTLNSEILVDNVSVIDVAELNQTYTLIPDLNFESKLISLGIDSGVADGKVLTNNVNQLTSLNVSSSSIVDLTGIQDFVGLTYLNCGRNQLTNLDVTKNTALTDLYCFYNQITSIDVSQNTNLKWFMCHFNELTTINVSNNPKLELFDCLNNKITSLDISKNPLITELACENNQLTYLNLKNGANPILDLTYSNFVNNPNLKCIQVDDASYSNANWASIKDITANYSTDCTPYTLIPDVNFENKLIALGIDSGVADGKVLTSSISSLTALSVSSSSITDLTGVQDFISLKTLNCSGNKLTTIDLSKNVALINLDCKSNQLTSLDVSGNIALEDLSCYSNQLTTLDVSKNVSLVTLSCYSNQLNDLDVSKNIVLTTLLCYSNQLTALDVSKNTALTNLTCSYNQLTSLDISKNIFLTYIDTGSNKLTTLDISQNINLITFSCRMNQLTSLDVSKNVALTALYCNTNNLVSLNLKNGNNTLFTPLNLKDNPSLTCIQVDDAIYSNANWSSIKDNTANFNTDCATSNLYTYIPDVNFENKLISLGIDSSAVDGKVLTSNVASLTSLDVSNSNISNLAGIENFTSLKKLDCGHNKLSTLNVSNSKNLNELSCRYNNLIALDISANLNLTSLDCIYNHITTLDVSSALGLKSLLCTSNQITNLDVTNNLDLDWFGCNANQITTLDVSQNKMLRYLDCGFNQLTSLDISNNLSLFYLNCYHNKLTSLDVSMLTELTTLACSESQFSSFDVSNNVKLSSLLCENINVTTLDLSKNTALTELYCGNNEQLTTLDLSKNKKLTTFLCFNNHLTDLNIKNGTNTLLVDVDFKSNSTLTCIQVDDATYSNTNWASKKDVTASYSTNCSPYTLIPDSNFEQKLIDLGIDTDGLNGKVNRSIINTLTSLDVSESGITSLTGIEDFVALTSLNCSSNQLISLDVSKNEALRNFSCNSNQLTYLNLKNGNNSKFNTISFIDNPKLSCIQVDDYDYSNANWSDKKDNTASYSIECTVYALIPDSSFEQKLIDLGIDTDGLNGKISTTNINSITSLDLSNTNITDLTGIENFTALKYFTANSNNLTSVDFSKNLMLQYVSISGNNLTSLDVSKNTNLSELDFSNNKVTQIDLSQNKELTVINALGNQLTTLDISQNPKIKSLNVDFNQLTSLNLQNGNNANFVLAKPTNKISQTVVYTSFSNNPNLSCIKVDNVAYSNQNWSKIKDATATYSSTCSALGIEDSVFDKVAIFPNPTKGELHIDNIVLEKATVYDALGKLVKTTTFTSGTNDNTMHLEGFASGIYYIYLESEGANTAKKIIVE